MDLAGVLALENIVRIAEFLNPPYVEDEPLFFWFVLDLAVFSQTCVALHSGLSQYLQDGDETMCKPLIFVFHV